MHSSKNILVCTQRVIRKYKGYIRVIEEVTLLRHYYIEMDLHKEWFKAAIPQTLGTLKWVEEGPTRQRAMGNSVVILFDKLCL